MAKYRISNSTLSLISYETPSIISFLSIILKIENLPFLLSSGSSKSPKTSEFKNDYSIGLSDIWLWLPVGWSCPKLRIKSSRIKEFVGIWIILKVSLSTNSFKSLTKAYWCKLDKYYSMIVCFVFCKLVSNSISFCYNKSIST